MTIDYFISKMDRMYQQNKNKNKTGENKTKKKKKINIASNGKRILVLM